MWSMENLKLKVLTLKVLDNSLIVKHYPANPLSAASWTWLPVTASPKHTILHLIKVLRKSCGFDQGRMFGSRFQFGLRYLDILLRSFLSTAYPYISSHNPADTSEIVREAPFTKLFTKN